MIFPLLFALACADPATNPEGAPESAASAPVALPSESLYQLDLPLTDAAGQATTISLHRGHPTVVTLFYASCPMACPMLIRDARAFEERLTPEERANLRFLLVTLQPERDTPEALAKVVAEHGLDASRWTLARTKPEDLRPLAAALGISYRPAPDGEMNHASVLTLLDAEGRPVARLEGLKQDSTVLVEALRGL